MSGYVKVPHDALQPETLEALVEEFITREGTDYGEREHSLTEKKGSVMRQLIAGHVAIVFDVESESTTLMRSQELAELMGAAQARVIED